MLPREILVQIAYAQKKIFQKKTTLNANIDVFSGARDPEFGQSLYFHPCEQRMLCLVYAFEQSKAKLEKWQISGIDTVKHHT